MIRNILIGLVVLVVAAVGVAFVLPQHPHMQRETVVSATPEQVFSIVNDMSRWNDWAPWAKMDPDMKLKFDGPAKGVGAKMAWSSAKLGDGAMTITESTAFSQIKTALDFGGGGLATSTFTFAPTDGGTKVIWSFDSDAGMNPIARYFGLFVDTMVGKDYESGLASLKDVAESEATAEANAAQAQEAASAPPDVPPLPAAADPDKGPEVMAVEARPIVMMRASATMSDPKAVSDALGAANQKILDYATKHNLELGGAPLAITISHEGGKWTFDAALPLDAAPASPPAEEGGVKVGQTYAGKVVKLTHKGPYNTLNDTYARIHAYTKANNLKEGTTSWEEYVNDPGETAEEDLLTNVYVVVKE